MPSFELCNPLKLIKSESDCNCLDQGVVFFLLSIIKQYFTNISQTLFADVFNVTESIMEMSYFVK